MPICERDPWRDQYFENVPCPDNVLIATDDFDAWPWYPKHNWIYDKLRIAQGPVKPLADTPTQPKRRTAPPPLPAHQEAELKASVATAPDSLKGSLERLGRAVLSDRDGASG